MCDLFQDPEHSELYRKYRPKYPKEVFDLIDRKLTESTDNLPEDLKENPEHAELYRKYRPKYPKEVFDLIDRKLTESTDKLPEDLKEKYKRNQFNRWKVALDVGCGTGQATNMLVDFVQESFGIDASESQIYQAKVEYGNKDPSRITFLCEEALKISQMFEENSVDLIIAAQAVQWFDRPKFYKECMKLLRPGGLLALIGYNLFVIENEEAEKINKDFSLMMTSEDRAAQSMDVVEKYKTIFQELKCLYPNAERDDSYAQHVCTNVDDFIGYLRTWGIYHDYRKLHPTHPDPLIDVRDKLEKIFPDGTLAKRKSDYFILFASKE